jgi:hypothetical protein
MAHEFDPLALDKSMPKSAEEAILLLLRAWPLFEIALTDWLIAVAGMNSDDIGALMVGRMETRGKIEKLKDIYGHLGGIGRAKLKQTGAMCRPHWHAGRS